MAGTPERRTIRLRDRTGDFPTLHSIGFALQRFSAYRHVGAPRLHGHDILEMNFVVAGTGRQIIGDSSYPIGPGSLGITHYGEAHELITDGAGIDIVNLYLDPERHTLPRLPEPLATALAGLLPPGPFPGRRRVCFLHLEAHARFAALLGYLCAEQEEEAAGHESVLLDGLRMILIACARAALAGGVEVVTENRDSWEAMERVRRRLDRDFAQPQCLADLASEAGCTRAHLCRRFKAYAGTTVFGYLLERRIRHARQLLRTTDAKILAVAAESGFADLGFFNRTFRRLTGRAPGAYRREQSAIGEDGLRPGGGPETQSP